MIAFVLLAALAMPKECTALGPIYWEMGDANGPIESGSQGRDVRADTVLPVASASKWLFAAYVAETRVLSESDKAALRMISGYTEMRMASCIFSSTVASCMSRAGGLNAANQGRFFYNGAHYQHWAVENGLGDDTPTELAARMSAALHIPVEMRTPQPAGGAALSAAGYSAFLRKLLKHDLKLAELLGKDAVGEDPVHSPAPKGWLYSYGHWIEDDGTYSSPGLFGFYPWISGETYGVVSRHTIGLRAYFDSAACGRALRKAFAERPSK